MNDADQLSERAAKLQAEQKALLHERLAKLNKLNAQPNGTPPRHAVAKPDWHHSHNAY